MSPSVLRMQRRSSVSRTGRSLTLTNVNATIAGTRHLICEGIYCIRLRARSDPETKDNSLWNHEPKYRFPAITVPLQPLGCSFVENSSFTRLYTDATCIAHSPCYHHMISKPGYSFYKSNSSAHRPFQNVKVFWYSYLIMTYPALH